MNANRYKDFTPKRATRHAWLWLLFLAAACAQPPPQEAGVYLRDGRGWQPLVQFGITPLFEEEPPSSALRLPGRITHSRAPRLALVSTGVTDVTAWRVDASGRQQLGVNLEADAARPDVTLVRLGGPAPRGLLVFQLGNAHGAAFLNGADPWFLQQLAEAEWADDNRDAAIALYEEVVAIRPAALAQERLARMYLLAEQNPQRAQVLAERAAAAASSPEERARLQLTLGLARVAAGDLDGGLESVEEAIALQPENRRYARSLATLIASHQAAPPEAVLQRWHAAIAKNEYNEAAGLSLPEDVRRLVATGRLKATLRETFAGDPYPELKVRQTVLQGRTARVAYALSNGQEGEMELRFESRHWKVALP